MQSIVPTRAGIRFGEFELDHSGELRSRGRKIKLQEQPLQILRILAERAGEIVTREDLRQKIWPSDTFVDFDHGINNAIKRLREALGDTADDPARRIHGILSPMSGVCRTPEREYFLVPLP
jgi:DNA-binding winged helix-turn-helix (wHTH) protein